VRSAFSYSLRFIGLSGALIRFLQFFALIWDHDTWSAQIFTQPGARDRRQAQVPPGRSLIAGSRQLDRAAAPHTATLLIHPLGNGKIRGSGSVVIGMERDLLVDVRIDQNRTT
jgi:hypothetical protein